MAGIWNVNSIYNSNVKKVSSKLTFQVGEVFSARIVTLDGQKGEGILKLLDGWQFAVKVEKAIDLIPAELLKLQVVGFEEGKLKVKILSSAADKGSADGNSIENILVENNIGIEEYDILEKMVKHNMELSKENISKIKSLNDFMKKIWEGMDFEETFIKNYLDSKNISLNTSEGKEIQDTLKVFFKELKNINSEELLTLLENYVEINAENINSFNKVFKGSMKIYNSLMEIGEALKDTNKDVMNQNEKGLIVNYNTNNNSSELKHESDTDLIKAASSENNELKDIVKEIIVDNGEKFEVNADKSSPELVREQIRLKTEEIKNIIKDILIKGKDMESEAYTKVADLLKNTINDFKVFNTVSNAYYYMDLPVTLRDQEYPCKIIIKDDRNKGKRIDSKDVKLVVSVKTVNMGTIDGYIKVKNLNINIEVQSDEQWIKVLEVAKEKLLNNLSGNGYNINLTIARKKKEVNLTNCRDFFQDFGLSNIDTKV